ncbi:MAG: cytochrome c oxidase accessory protein CcoG [Planctomycetes bacterium]|nr:cytochrome c oxidase accessory protein CcoG [Planctomycetota bacterium]
MGEPQRTSLLDAPEHVLSTLQKDGSRRWLRPRLSHGHFLTARRIAAYLLIVIFTAIPYTSINGKPTILLDVVHRQFTLFGKTFLPTDTVLLALGMVGFIITIFLFTAVLGRVWCGWACPQTVYMEFVFRPIERLCHGTAGRGGAANRPVPKWRMALKHVLYFLISIYLAHTFLAYFVGVENLRHWILGSPFEHPVAFVVMTVTTLLMLFDFGYFREQMCILACPYGRFQSVMLDRQSLIISYDPQRGEPRGKFEKHVASGARRFGDCVDCHQCVTTCPTGIDIRQGLQLECIGCAQCIDACDAVMVKLGRSPGLIRYSSQDAIDGKPRRRFRPRLVFYPTLLVIIAALLAVVVSHRQPADITLMRNPGLPFVLNPDGRVANNLRVKITNRQSSPASFSVSIIDDPQAQLTMSSNPVMVKPGESLTVGLVITLPREVFVAEKHPLKLRVTDGDAVNRQLDYQMMGPSNGANHE